MKKLPLTSILLLLFVSCATVVQNPEQVAERTTIEYDPYEAVYSVKGMKFDIGGFPNITQVWLRAGFTKDGSHEFFQLYVYHWSQTGWKFLSTASDIDANQFNLRRIDADVQGEDNAIEQVAVDLDKEYLKRHAASGINIRVLGREGSVIVKLPGEYISGFIQKYDELKENAIASQ